MLRELAAVLASDEYQRDPCGALHAWADVASGRVRPDAPYLPSDGNGHAARFDDLEMVIMAIATAGAIRNGDVRRAVGYTVSSETVRVALGRLVDLGLLERRGIKSGTRYVAAPCDRG
jgi:hypothetical protein